MQRLRTLTLFLLPCLGILGLSDTALGQTLTITDSQTPPNTIIGSGTTTGNMLPFNVGFGGTGSQVLTINCGGCASTAQFQVSNVPGTGTPPTWLRINPGTGGAVSGNFSVIGSRNFTVEVNTASLSQNSYQGSFLLAISGFSTVTINVSLNVTGSAVLSATPSSLSYSAIQGSSTASGPTQVVVNSTAGTLGLTITPTSQGNWLGTPTSGSTGVAFNVSVNPSGLGLGTYNGSITVQSQSSADSLVIPVTLVVSSTSTITISPTTPAPFLYQVGGATPAAQTITVSSAATTSVNISVGGAFWLVAQPSSAVVGPSNPFPFQLSVNPTGLTAGTYNTTLTITPASGNALNVPVQLVVSNNSLLQVSVNSLTFNSPFASASSPADKTVNITTTGGTTVFFNVNDDATWLSTSVSQNFVNSSSPATLTVHVSPTGLAVGTYTGTISIQPTNGDNYTQTVAVTYVVGTSATVTVGPPVLYYSYQTTVQLPSAQTLRVTSPAQSIAFSLATSVSGCGTGWLTLSSSSASTPADISVSVNGNISTTGVSATPTTCTGQVTITYSGGQTINVPVTVALSTSPLLVIGQPRGFGNYVVAQGGVVNSEVLGITSSTFGQSLPFSVQATTCSWVSIAGGAGSTAANVFVSFLSSGLLPGLYGCNLVITSTAIPGGSFTIPITLLVTPNVGVTIAPTTLTFTQPFGGPLPGSQNLTFTATGGGTPTYEATISQGCTDLISVTPASGPATGTVEVKVLQNSRSLGSYVCQISFVLQGASTQSQQVQVTVNVTNPQTIAAAPTSLSFAYQLTAAQPPSQKFTVTSTGGSVQFTVGTSSTPTGWLSTDITSGSTGTSGKDVNVSINTQNLGVGHYNGSITVTPTGLTPITIQVGLDVTSAPTPLPTTILSTASNQAGAITPGGLTTIKGTLLGPTTQGGVLFTLNAQGGVDSTLAGVQVTFDGIPGTPIYVSATQINVIVPYEISGRATVNMVVVYNGVSSAQINTRVVEAAPAIFTLNQQGFGQAAAVNQNGTFNGPAGSSTVPATQDSVVAVYATGGGQTNPPGTTGSVSPTNRLLRINGIVSATVDGVPASVEFAGAAPGLVTGVNQYNIRIPRAQPGHTMVGNLVVQITINGVSSRGDVTIAVQ